VWEKGNEEVAGEKFRAASSEKRTLHLRGEKRKETENLLKSSGEKKERRGGISRLGNRWGRLTLFVGEGTFIVGPGKMGGDKGGDQKKSSLSARKKSQISPLQGGEEKGKAGEGGGNERGGRRGFGGGGGVCWWGGGQGLLGWQS